MAEIFALPAAVAKVKTHRAAVRQIESVISENDLIANLANVADIPKPVFDFHWVGFCRTTSPGPLVLKENKKLVMSRGKSCDCDTIHQKFLEQMIDLVQLKNFSKLEIIAISGQPQSRSAAS